MYQLILFTHVVLSLALIALVLLQHGKGADIGATFGSGASQTVFGSQGSASFLMKFTGMLGVAFFITSLVLGALAAESYKKSRVITFPKSQVTTPESAVTIPETTDSESQVLTTPDSANTTPESTNSDKKSPPQE